jgi:hypothetical protein
MTIEQVEEIFNDYGYTLWFRNIRYPIMASKELEHTDPNILIHFFERYSFDADESPSFEEFMYHFVIFKKVYINNSLPFDVI